MKAGESITIRVEAIANGFLVQEGKGEDYSNTFSGRLFYPTLESVERELVIRFRAAQSIVCKPENF